MRTGFYLCIVGLGALAQGCGPLANVARTLVIEPVQDWRLLDCAEELKRDCKLAAIAWDNFQETCPEAEFSADFARGFKRGYVDFLYAGGTGEPPPVPPRYYWRAGYETPEGHQAIDDWFKGFRRGAALARASGLRRLVPVPTSLVAGPDAGGPPPEVLPPPEAGPPSAPVLPPPREAPGEPMPGAEPAASAPSDTQPVVSFKKTQD
jgi:hypothetical protein